MLGKRPRLEELTVGAIEHPQIPGLGGLHHDFAGAPFEGQVNQVQLESRIVVPNVLRDLLVVPFQPAGVGVEGHDATRVEIIAAAAGGVEVRRGIADAPVEKVQFRIVGAGHPGGTATVAPAFARPRIVALFARAGDGVEPPAHAAGLDVKGGEIAAVRGIAAGDAGHNDVLDQQRRARDVTSALALILHVDAPQLRTGPLVERHHVVVRSADEHASMAHGHTTILLAVSQALAEGEVVLPNDPAAGAVKGEYPGVGSGKVDDAVDHDGGGLQTVLVIAGLENPCWRQCFDVRRVDLVEPAIAQSGMGATVARPILQGGQIGARQGGGKNREKAQEFHFITPSGRR